MNCRCQQCESRSAKTGFFVLKTAADNLFKNNQWSCPIIDQTESGAKSALPVNIPRQ
jgi:hypothetical protein